MKSVLLSIQPKWCELIASRKKTVEVRKSAPKLETPFVCYIYCTKAKNKNEDFWSDARAEPILENGEEHLEYVAESLHYMNGKVIGEFVCDDIMADMAGQFADVFYWDGGLTLEEQINYGGEKMLYGWHITDLKIYDAPKELGEFWNYNEELHKKFERGEDYCCYDGTNEYGELLDKCSLFNESVENCYRCWEEWSGWCHRVTRPPQSWCYVEEIKE